jgi:hypothetical protein
MGLEVRGDHPPVPGQAGQDRADYLAGAEPAVQQEQRLALAVLRRGRRTSATTTSAGVIIAVYQPAGPPRYGSYAGAP